MARDRAYLKGLLARTKAAREATGMSQGEFAKALGLRDREAWSKYETRSPVPHEMIAALSERSGFSISYIITGRN